MSKYGFLNSYTNSATGIDIGRTKFNITQSHLTTFSSGYWFPVFCVETLPGDTFEVNLKELIRMLSPVVPTMDNLIAELQAFYVPMRLATRDINDWKNIAVGSDPSAWVNGFDQDLITTNNVINLSNVKSMSLANYLGVPISSTTSSATTYYNVSRCPFNAVMRIWNEWLRDENLMDEFDWVGLSTSAPFTGNIATAGILKASKLKDYFTSALPAPQKGGAVYVPLGDYARVNMAQAASPSTDTTLVDHVNVSNDVYISNNLPGESVPSGIPAGNTYTQLYVDLSEATGASVNAIRMSFALQRLQEKLARGGSRYNEFLHSVFGVNAPTGMLEMSEYIGGGSFPINISQVLQTSSSDSTTPLGYTGAYSNTFDGRISFTKSFVDYGYMVIMCTVRPTQSYSQGLPLIFRRYSPIDMYSPTFAFIGEQPIYSEEIFASADNQLFNSSGKVSAPNVFGYKEPWAEYKNPVKRVTGNFAVGSGDNTLEAWTYTTYFSASPTLSASFIAQPSSQVGQTLINTQTTTQFIGDFVCEIIATRPMPAHSVPGLLDHF